MTSSPTNKSQTSKIFFAEESGVLIGEILEKYGLSKQQEEGLNAFFKAPVGEEEKALKELPGPKIGLLLREYQKGKIKLEEFSTILQEVLKISAKDAEAITEELKEKVILSKPPEKETAPPSETKTTSPKSPDVYREAVE